MRVFKLPVGFGSGRQQASRQSRKLAFYGLKGCGFQPRRHLPVPTERARFREFGP
jgi:hypothetical protein